MSEDILLHFREVPWEEVEAALNYLAPRHPERATLPHRWLGAWLYPEGLNFVMLHRYIDLHSEHSPEEIEALQDLLGGPPSCSLGVNFRRTRHHDVCTIVEYLSVRLLTRFSGVADDNLGEFWTLDKIEAGAVKSAGKFLDPYRIN